MHNTYKAVPYKVVSNHGLVVDEREPWDTNFYYNKKETRFCIIDSETGEILDDAQGYGYKTAQKAYSAYAYKIRSYDIVKEKEEKEKNIRKWMKEHKEFVNLINGYAIEIAKGSMSPDDRFDAKFVEELLVEYDLHIDFTASELLKVWQKS